MKCKGILCKFIGGRLLIHIQVKDTVLLTKLFCAISKLWSIDSVRNIFFIFSDHPVLHPSPQTWREGLPT